MILEQAVVIASWDAERREFVAKVGQETVEGLTAITNKLSENGCEITSVVVLESSSAPTSASTKSNPKARIAADVLAIFINVTGQVREARPMRSLLSRLVGASEML